MNLNLHFGKDNNGKDIYIDIQKERLHTIFMTGTTGSGKSILHYYLYQQLMKNNSPEELKFVFLDMTRVDFGNWNKDYLYLPVVNDPSQALNALEMLANQNELKKTVFIHVEECDMFLYSSERFINAWKKIKNNKNMFILFSTSRPSPEIVTNEFLSNTDLKLIFNLASEDDSITVLGKSMAEKLINSGEKIICYKKKEILTAPFDKDIVDELNKIYG